MIKAKPTPRAAERLNAISFACGKAELGDELALLNELAEVLSEIPERLLSEIKLPENTFFQVGMGSNAAVSTALITAIRGHAGYMISRAPSSQAMVSVSPLGSDAEFSFAAQSEGLALLGVYCNVVIARLGAND